VESLLPGIDGFNIYIKVPQFFSQILFSLIGNKSRNRNNHKTQWQRTKNRNRSNWWRNRLH